MTRFVSLNQFVNTWECDENDHMNVQFYFAKFDDAATVFAAIHGLEAALGPRLSRHVRYHKEMRSAAQLQILSSLVRPQDRPEDSAAEGLEGTLVQHVMIDTVSGGIAATALDHHTGSLNPVAQEGIGSILGAISDKQEPLTKPRGIKGETSLNAPTFAPDRIVFRSVLHPDLCRADGTARDQAYIGAMSDAASHTWDEIGINCQWLEEQGFGRMAVEMRLCLVQPMKAGDLYQMQNAYTGLTTRAFSKRLDFFGIRDQTHFGYVESTVMLLNHNTRRSEPLPDFACEAISQRLES